MKKLLLIINEHGGVGRTTTGAVLASHLDRKGIDAASVHTCESDLVGDSHLWDLDEGIDGDQLVEFIDSADVTLIDVAGRHGESLCEFFAETDIYEQLAELDAEITVILPVTPDSEMGDAIVRIGEQFADEASYIVVHSSVLAGDSDAEEFWSGSYAEKVLSYLGAVDVEMPEFKEELLGQIQEHHGMDIPTALASRKELPRFLRDEIHRWEIEFAENLSVASDQLVPGETHTRSVYA